MTSRAPGLSQVRSSRCGRCGGEPHWISALARLGGSPRRVRSEWTAARTAPRPAAKRGGTPRVRGAGPAEARAETRRTTSLALDSSKEGSGRQTPASSDRTTDETQDLGLAAERVSIDGPSRPLDEPQPPWSDPRRTPKPPMQAAVLGDDGFSLDDVNSRT